MIGALWSISDTDAPKVARQVYQQLKDSSADGISGTGPALDAAIRALRDMRRTDPWLWASYIHLGP